MGQNTLKTKVRHFVSPAQNLAAAHTPILPDFIGDFDDYVDFHIKADQISKGLPPIGNKMSEKNVDFVIDKMSSCL